MPRVTPEAKQAHADRERERRAEKKAQSLVAKADYPRYRWLDFYSASENAITELAYEAVNRGIPLNIAIKAVEKLVRQRKLNYHLGSAVSFFIQQYEWYVDQSNYGSKDYFDNIFSEEA
jgi:hypothetical protein